MLVLEYEWAAFRVVMIKQNFVTSVVAQNLSQILQVYNHVVKCVSITRNAFTEVLAILSNDIVMEFKRRACAMQVKRYVVIDGLRFYALYSS